jgi:PAS domain-containing protein
LAAVPSDDWSQTIRRPLFVAHGSGFIVILLATGLVYLTVDRQQRLSQSIMQRTQALRESEERFRHLFSDASVGIALVDDGVVVAANAADCDFLGYAEDELVGMHFSEFTHPDDLDLDQAKYYLLVRSFLSRYSRFSSELRVNIGWDIQQF